MRLDELPIGKKATIVTVKGGRQQRRLQDLGFVCGVEIQCICQGPLKDPRLYRLLKTSVALRNQDAALILVGCEAQ